MEVINNDVHWWAAADKPEEKAWLASVSKRACAEVCIKNFNLEENLLFEKAKDTELNYWIPKSALKPILRKKLILNKT